MIIDQQHMITNHDRCNRTPPARVNTLVRALSPASPLPTSAGYRSMPRLVLLGLLASAACWASEPAVSGPLIDATLTDGQHLLSHWELSIYGRLWNDPLFAARRDAWTAQLTALQTGVGLTLHEVVQGLNGASLHILPPAAGAQLPEPQLEGDFSPAIAGRLMQALRAINSDPDALKELKLQGASEAVDVVASRLLVERIAGLLLVTNDHAHDPAHPWKASALPAASDLAVTLDVARLLAALPAAQAAQVESALKPIASSLGSIDYRAELVADGMHERWTSHAPPGTPLPVNRDLLALLPAKTLLTLAFAIDGKAIWQDNRTTVLDQIISSTGAPTPEAALQQVDQQLSAMGLNVTLTQLVEGLRGTVVLAVTPGFPFPSPTLMLPRSAGVDQLVGLALKLLQLSAPPTGQSIPLPLPGIPIPITLAATAEQWILSGDAALSAGCLTGKPGGWNDSPAGKAALAHALASSTLIGASDTPSVLTTISSLAALALNQIAALDAQDKQAILQGLARLAGLAKTGWLVAYTESGQRVLEDRGIIGIGPFAAIAVAAAFRDAAAPGIPAHGDPLSGAIAVLTTQILPGEQAFQRGVYLDQDGDGHGEFGFLSELAGLRGTAAAPQGVLQLIDSHIASGPVDGFAYAIFLPDGKGGATGEPAAHGPRPADPAAAGAQARHFVAYAWPTTPSGGRMYAITEAGVVFSAAATGHAPAWGDLFGGAGWEAAPTWSRETSKEPAAPQKAPGTF